MGLLKPTTFGGSLANQTISGGATGALGFGFGQLSNALNMRRQFKYWKKQQDYMNAYNAPEAQVERLKQAGLNPGLMYSGNGGSSMQGSVTPMNSQSGPMNTVDPLAMQRIQNETKVANAEANYKNSLAAGQEQTNFEQIETWSMRKTVYEVETYMAEQNKKFWDATYNERVQMVADEAKILSKSLDKLTEELKVAEQQADEAKFRSEMKVTVTIGDNQYQVPYYQALMIREVERLTEQINALKSGQVSDKAKALHDAAMADYYNVQKPYVEQWELYLKQEGLNIQEYEAFTDRFKLKFNIQTFEENMKFAIHQYNEAMRLKKYEMVMSSLKFMSMMCMMGAGLAGGGSTSAMAGAYMGTQITPYDSGAVVFAD